MHDFIQVTNSDSCYSYNDEIVFLNIEMVFLDPKRQARDLIQSLFLFRVS